jgi:osmoprotectant transport system permease protein
VRRLGLALALLALALLALAPGAGAAAVVGVGSKSFTESYVLAEIAAQVIETIGDARVDRRLGLGGTGITYRALAHGRVDVGVNNGGDYRPSEESSRDSVEAIREGLRPLGLTISDPLGFENTYALAVRDDVARRLGLARISDLAGHPELSAAFTSGFLERDDGWPGLRRHYGLGLSSVRVIEHALAYQALARGAVDVIDVFSTDGRLTRPGLVVLRDDRHFFPTYAAVLFARRDFVERQPHVWAALERAMVGRIDGRAMAGLNAMADLDRRTVRQTARASSAAR